MHVCCMSVYVYVHVSERKHTVERSDDNFVSYMILKMKLTPSGLCDNFLYSLSHLTVAHQHESYISKLQSDGHFYVIFLFLSPHTFGNLTFHHFLSISQSVIFLSSSLPLSLFKTCAAAPQAGLRAGCRQDACVSCQRISALVSQSCPYPGEEPVPCLPEPLPT